MRYQYQKEVLPPTPRAQGPRDREALYRPASWSCSRKGANSRCPTEDNKKTMEELTLRRLWIGNLGKPKGIFIQEFKSMSSRAESIKMWPFAPIFWLAITWSRVYKDCWMPPQLSGVYPSLSRFSLPSWKRSSIRALSLGFISMIDPNTIEFCFIRAFA